METLRFILSSSFYPPYHLGGDATHVQYLAEELAKKGHEVHIFHSLDAYEAKRGRPLPPMKENNQENLFIHTVKSPLGTIDPFLIYVIGNSLWVDSKFSQLVRKVNPDVVHHHNISLLGYDLLRKRANYLSLYTAHDYWLICPTNNLFKNQERLCDEKSCASCAFKSKRFPQVWRSLSGFKSAISNIDLLISPSEYVRSRLIKEIKIKSVTLPNFVPLPPQHISSLVVVPQTYFLFLGMLEKHKGILQLLELFKEIQFIINAKLVIAGGGSLTSHIKNYIKKNSLENSVLFLGFVDDETKYSLYANALAVIIPSIWPENAPLVALEALSVGTPVISSNQGGLPEIVRKVDRTLIFDNWNILKLILLSFSGRNRKKIQEIYEKEFSAQAYTDNYLQVVRKSLQ